MAFIEEVDEADIVEEPLALLVVFQRPPAVFEEPMVFLDDADEVRIVAEPLAAANKIIKSSRAEFSSVTVLEAIQRGRRCPCEGLIPHHKAAFSGG